MPDSRIILPGTKTSTPPNRKAIGPVPGQMEIGATLTLRGKNDLHLSPLQAAGAALKKQLSVWQVVRSFSHTARDEAVIRRFAREYDLRSRNDGPCQMLLRGSIEQMNHAFGVRLFYYSENNSVAKYRAHDEEVTLPAYLDKVVTGVFGLNTRPAARRHGLTHTMAALGIKPPPVTSKTRKPAEFAELYNFPATTGRRQSIGLLEFGGGFRSRSLKSYFKSAGVAGPRIVVKEIPPGANQPTGKHGTINLDTEVYLDIEVAASLAPQATVVVYFGENTEQGWLRTLRTAIFDARHDLSVISISWGQAEQQWSPRAIVEIDRLFQLAAHRGITICCSSGDSGISEFAGHPFTIAFPASSPHVLACGGTRLAVTPGGARDEIVWNQWRQYKLASGGGISSVFSVPPYQAKVKLPLARSPKHNGGRGIPDVAANASSKTGYLIEADSTRMSMGGTSAAAPLWATLIARLNEALGRKIGFLTPLLYEMDGKTPKAVCDIVKGFNGPTRTRGYQARRGWDACTGLGSPNGKRILDGLKHRIKKER